MTMIKKLAAKSKDGYRKIFLCKQDHSAVEPTGCICFRGPLQ
jgi:hypothetical protein